MQYNRLDKFCKVFAYDTTTVRIRTVVIITNLNWNLYFWIKRI
jgi:hypothetical protein